MSNALEQWRRFCGSMVDHDHDYEEIRAQAEALAAALAEEIAIREDMTLSWQKAEAALAEAREKDREHYEAWKKDQAAWKACRDEVDRLRKTWTPPEDDPPAEETQG